MYIGQAKHPIFNGGTFGILSAESPEHPVQVQGGNPAMASAMDQMGLPFEPTTGKYTNPENSFVVHGASAEQLHSLAKQFGQTAFIHSEGGRHRFHYANGPNEGKWHEADEQNPVEHFEQPPPDMYTTVPGGHGHFRIAFKWDQLHGNDVAKNYSVEEAVALLLKSTGRLVKTLPALAPPAAPALHATVEGFMGGFKALPKDGPMRGKFITQHMNHGPFLSALQAHPQGKQIHSQLTSFLNSKVNAGPGKAVATVKSMLEKSDLTANVAALRAESQYKPHPHNYEWHDGHTSHHEVVDHAMPGLPGLAKSAAPGDPDYQKKWVVQHDAGHGTYQASAGLHNRLQAQQVVELHYTSKKTNKAVHLGTFPDKHAAKQAMLEHHDQVAAGLIKNLAKNDQAAGAGVSTYARYAVPFGNVVPGKQTNLLHYDYHQKLPDVEKLVHDHGYKTYYAGGKYGKPDLANKNYNTGHLMVYDPTPASGGDFGHETYTKAWRQIHELAHALTYPELNKTYGEGRRIGKLGTHRSLHEALRAVHWEHLAAHKQRELSAQIGVPLTDEQFHKEYNTVMHDAIHRAVTGKFTEPGAEGFTPHGRAIPLHHSLQMVRDAANEMGLNGLHQKLTKALPPHPESIATAETLQEQGFSPAKPNDHLYRRGVIPYSIKIPFPLKNKREGTAEKLLPFGVQNPVTTDVSMAPLSRDPTDSNYGGQLRQPLLGNAEADALGQELNQPPTFNDEHSTAQNIPTKEAMLDAFARSPIMRMKKTSEGSCEPIAKAWPKDEKENQANAAAHPVMEDAFLEQGAKKTVHRNTVASLRSKARQLGHGTGATHRTSAVRRENYNARVNVDPEVRYGFPAPTMPSHASPELYGYDTTPYSQTDFDSSQNDHDYWRSIGVAVGAEHEPIVKGWPAGATETQDSPENQANAAAHRAITERAEVFGDKQEEQGLPRTGVHPNALSSIRARAKLANNTPIVADRIATIRGENTDIHNGQHPGLPWVPEMPAQAFATGGGYDDRPFGTDKYLVAHSRARDQAYWAGVGRTAGIQKSELAKALPKTRKENTQNEAYHNSVMQVVEDKFLEQGGKKTEHGPDNQATQLSNQVSGNQEGTPEYAPEYDRSMAARWDNSMDALNYNVPPGLRGGAFALGVGVNAQPHATGATSVPNEGWPNGGRYIDGAKDREYWEAVDSEPAVGPGRQLLPSFHDTPVSNATQSILRSRSPVGKRVKLGKSELAKALPKTRKENAQNEAYHNSAMQVVEDQFLEQGGKKQDSGVRAVLDSVPLAGRNIYPAADANLAEAHALQDIAPTQNQHNAAYNLVAGVGMAPFGVSAYVPPSVESAGTKWDKESEKRYWGLLGDEPVVGPNKQLLPSFHDTPVSNATKNILRSRSPVGKMKKAWPRNDAENLENQKGFLSSPVAQDHYMENIPAGHQVTVAEAPAGPHHPRRDNVAESPGVHPETLQSGWNSCRNCGEDFDMEDPSATLCPNCDEYYANDGIVRENATEAHTQEPAIPWTREYGKPNHLDLDGADAAADKEYWRKVGSFTDREAARDNAFPGVNPNASNATAIPTKDIMLDALSRSPIMKRNTPAK